MSPVKSSVSIPFSIVAFPSNVEPFLLYSKGFERGPQIKRDGRRSPWMQDRENPAEYTTDPRRQRTGTWYIDPEVRERDAPVIREEAQELLQLKNNYEERLAEAEHMSEARGRRIFQELINQTGRRIRSRNDLLDVVPETSDYLTEFEAHHGDYRVVGMQGCGNLTMNDWFVGFLNSSFTENRPTFLYLPSEAPLMDERRYTCLVKWKSRGPRVSVEELRFNPFKESSGRELIHQGDFGEDITEDVEFVVYGQQLIKNGQLTNLRDKVPEISDIRHLFRLVNINPRDELWPRRYFGEDQYDDVWFGEAYLLDNTDVRQSALYGPVKLECNYDHMGADIDDIANFLIENGYFNTGGEAINSSGQFRVVEQDSVEIYLHRNVYAYTMLGVSSEGELISMAIGGKAGRLGQTIEAAAQNMLNYGLFWGTPIEDALLIDQGNDVFQKARIDDELVNTVEPNRAQLRAAIILGEEK